MIAPYSNFVRICSIVRPSRAVIEAETLSGCRNSTVGNRPSTAVLKILAACTQT